MLVCNNVSMFVYVCIHTHRSTHTHAYTHVHTHTNPARPTITASKGVITSAASVMLKIRSLLFDAWVRGWCALVLVRVFFCVCIFTGVRVCVW